MIACALALWLATSSPASPASPPPASPPAAWAADRPVLLQSLPRAPTAAAVTLAAQRLEAQDPNGALSALAQADSSAASLVRARALRSLGKFPEAGAALAGVPTPGPLELLRNLEEGRLAAARQDAATTVQKLLPLLQAGGPLATATTGPLIAALTQSDPATLLANFAALEQALPKKDDLDARSLLLDAKATAQEKLGKLAEARATRLQRYLEEPVSLTTPAEPPAGLVASPNQLMDRVERLLDAHRNDKALQAMDALPDASLDANGLCRKHFAQGLASRKLRRYAAAEEHLTYVMNQCADADLARRGAFLRAKVISIRDGLRAIEAIEAFASKYPDHSMTDDVLFWAGDLYQRRSRDDEAHKYYARIDALSLHDDYCGEARWRIAWMAYRRNDLPAAEAGFKRLLADDGCTRDLHDRSRSHYWLGRVAEQQKNPAAAQAHYQAILDTHPLSFYAQQGLPRLLKLQPKAAAQATSRGLLAPTGHPSMPLCPNWLANDPGFGRGMAYLQAGLAADAAAQFRALERPKQNVIGDAHAASLGVPQSPVELQSLQSLSQCGPAQAALLLVLLLDEAGAQHEAHWRLRTEFGDEFSKFPSAKEMVLWRAAYPLAYRNFIAPAEQESHLPAYFLQALAREESAFDPTVVSWAEAYGLTQLVLASGQGAGKFLSPPVSIKLPEQLLEPALNARLGGALLASLLKHYANNLGLALAGYNAGEPVASAWWKHFAGQDFALYAEEMTIQETRGYVKRVLRTYGIYRWLYASALPSLPVEPSLPALR